MKVNQKAMYLMLNQQVKSLQNQLSPAANVEQVNEIPENFNQTGWDTTIEKAELMISKMKQLRDVKGKRLTPQFYRSIYNRALIANNEIEKMLGTITAESDTTINYEAECIKLNAEIYALNIKVAEATAKAAEEAAQKAVEDAQKAAAEAQQAIAETAATAKSK